MSFTTIKKLATKYAKEFKLKTRDDGTEFVSAPNASEKLKELIFNCHGDRLPDDYVYETISNVLNAISEADDNSDAYDVLYSIEPDIYTSDLTKWLHSRNDRVYYLTEALEEYSFKDGFQLLAMAQQKEIVEIGSQVIAELEKINKD